MAPSETKTTKASAYKLKDLFDAKLVRNLARELSEVAPSFDAARFTKLALNGLTKLELTGRAWHLAEALQECLPQPFTRAAEVLIASLGSEHPSTEKFGLAPLRYMPHVFFVQKYGLEDFEAAMRAQNELTRRFSAESSIRAFLVRYPDRTYAQLREWATDPNVHVRRLVSEGTRPRLPWAPRLRDFQRDPRPVLALLELLKDDPERYVQRSVANNLNDIGKDHPEVVVELCQRWSKRAPAGRQWIIRHALRSLIKRGHPGALRTLGAGQRPEVRIGSAQLTPRVLRIGQDLRFAFTLQSASDQEQDLIVDYIVHFVKANGNPRAKVFKLKRVALPSGAELELRGRVSFQAMTTRQHYPGQHRLEVVVNGVVHPLAEFNVREAP